MSFSLFLLDLLSWQRHESSLPLTLVDRMFSVFFPLLLWLYELNANIWKSDINLFAEKLVCKLEWVAICNGGNRRTYINSRQNATVKKTHAVWLNSDSLLLPFRMFYRDKFHRLLCFIHGIFCKLRLWNEQAERERGMGKCTHSHAPTANSVSNVMCHA